MLNISFQWTCTECGQVNTGGENDVDSLSYLYCMECDCPHIVDVEVEIDVVSVENGRKEEEEQLREIHLRSHALVEISSDRGQTWHEVKINTTETDPDKCNFQENNLIRLADETKNLEHWKNYSDTIWEAKIDSGRMFLEKMM